MTTRRKCGLLESDTRYKGLKDVRLAPANRSASTSCPICKCGNTTQQALQGLPPRGPTSGVARQRSVALSSEPSHREDGSDQGCWHAPASMLSQQLRLWAHAARRRLDMNALAPTPTNDLCKANGIVAVGLGRHHLQGCIRLAWRASVQTMGTPRCRHSIAQTDNGPVSSSARVTANGSSAPAIASGDDAAFRSATTLPSSSRMQNGRCWLASSPTSWARHAGHG